MSRTMKPGRYWVILNRSNGRPVLFDGRCPVYWRRPGAQHDAAAHGITWSGNKADAVIRRCRIVVEREP